MWSLLDKKECFEHVLQIILDKKDLRVECFELLKPEEFEDSHMKGVKALFTTSAEGLNFVELFQVRDGITPQETRCFCALADQELMDLAGAADAFSATYIIFLVNGDPFEEGFPIYHIDRIVQETGDDFSDEQHILYVNSINWDNTELGNIMHDLNCTVVEKMRDTVFAKMANKIHMWL